MSEPKSPLAQLIGCRVSIGISEPWDFGSEVTQSSFVGEISDIYFVTHIRESREVTREQVLIHIEKPFAYKQLKTEYLLASPRHKGWTLLQFANGKSVSFNFTRASAERASSDEVFDGIRWKTDPTFTLVGGMEVCVP